MTLPADLRELLVCPVCRRDLADVPDGLACRPCNRTYPIVDGVPWLLPELATPGPSSGADRAGR